jgi:hypothetical protein
MARGREIANPPVQREQREISVAGQLGYERCPLSGRLAVAIEAHGSVSAKRGELVRWLAAAQLGNQFLSDKLPRSDSVSPPQAVDVACQALGPDRSDFAWHQAVEAAARRNFERIPPAQGTQEIHRGMPGAHGDRDQSGWLIHPAARSSCAWPRTVPSSGACSMGSRPSDRWPGRRFFDDCAFGWPLLPGVSCAEERARGFCQNSEEDLAWEWLVRYADDNYPPEV